MKKSAFVIIIGFLFSFNQVSCNTSSNQNKSTNQDSSALATKQTTNPDYSGIYKTSADNLCQLSITITKEGQDYNYRILFDNQNYIGKLIIKNQEGQIYFTFDGKIGENEPKTVSGQFSEGKIIVQNYGNAMNEYHFFKSCDEKHLEFIKS